MFDVYVLEKETDPSTLPQEGTYYLVTNDGLYLHNDTDLFTSMVKVNKIPFLGSVQPKLIPKLPPIPPEVILKAWLFFRKVFRKRRAESELNLYYHKERKEYLLVCRPQGVSFGGVNYGRHFSRSSLQGQAVVEDREVVEELHRLSLAGYRKVGTIHSHCSFDAFHSETDIGDESEKDGIHITIGHVNLDNFSLVVSWSIGRDRFPLVAENIIQGVEPINFKFETPQRHGYFNSSGTSFFKIVLPLESQQDIEAAFQPTLDEWFEMIGEFREHNRGRGMLIKGQPPKEEVPEEASSFQEPFAVTVPVLALVETRDLRLVRSHASALKSNQGQIPQGRVEALKATIAGFFKKPANELTEDDINLAARVNPGRRIYDGEKAPT